MSGGNNSHFSKVHFSPPPIKKHHGGGEYEKKIQVEAIYKITGLSYLSQSIAKNTTHSQSQDILGKLNIEHFSCWSVSEIPLRKHLLLKILPTPST